jgi:hypothetical protein
MFETTKISHYDKASPPHCGNQVILGVLVTALVFLPVPFVMAERLTTQQTAEQPFANVEIAHALLTAPIVPSAAQDLANDFLAHTLPKLLMDSRLAHQLGFDDGRTETVTLDQALPLFRIYRNDVLKYLTERLDPLFAVNNTNNWVENSARELVARRLIFPIKINKETDSNSYWSSITLEQSSPNSWRIIQFGAPKLSRAMKDPRLSKALNAKQQNHFVLWIPDLNRHYLGEVTPASSDLSLATITLTVLFDDPLTHRRPGDRVEATSLEFIEDLKQLYEDLDLPKKLSRQRGLPKQGEVQRQGQIPRQAR